MKVVWNTSSINHGLQHRKAVDEEEDAGTSFVYIGWS